MNKISNHKFYKKSIEEFGVSAQGVHWNSKHTQYKRFEIITKLIKKEIKNSSIVDAGCGFAEYYHYLQTNNKVPLLYIGIDCEASMIEYSKKRFNTLTFFIQNIIEDKLHNADYYICSGGLNILTKEKISIFINKCFEASNKGFIFNYLKGLTFQNVSQSDIIEICNEYTNELIIKENYLENDFTIFMKK